MLVEQRRVAPDHATRRTLAIGSTQGQFIAWIKVQPCSTEQAIDVGHNRHVAPVDLYALVAFDKYRAPIDQPSSSLIQLHRAGQHWTVVITGTLQHRVLIGQASIVDADNAHVALERIDIGDHIVGCHGDMANVRYRGNRLTSHVAKVLGTDRAIGADQLRNALGLTKSRAQLGFQRGANPGETRTGIGHQFTFLALHIQVT
ncbi:hypothetical protein D3C77_473730 [compost metagenome]